MGCGASVNQVHVIDDDGVISKSGKQSGKKSRDANQRSQHRGDSATSQISRRSGDSGFDDEEEAQRQHESALLGLLLLQNFSHFPISYSLGVGKGVVCQGTSLQMPEHVLFFSCQYGLNVS